MPRSFPRSLLGLVALCIAVPLLHADPQPGDIFREYTWRDATNPWQRITWPGVTDERPKGFLPNATNTIVLRDLKSAERAEIQIELLQSHYGTVGQKVRVNGGEWIPIPPPTNIPGKLGSQPGTSDLWLTMRYPTVEVPIKSLVQGKNTFEFTCESGSGLGKWWPQSIVYGVTFRVFYNEYLPGAPAGDVIVANEKPSRQSTLSLAVKPYTTEDRSIHRVDFVASYNGYDWRGDGIYDRWHYHHAFGQIRRHAGTTHDAPWQVDWDVRWIPAQEKPIQVAAFIHDNTGLIRMTYPVTLKTFRGNPHVKMFTAHNIPPHWQTRDNHRDIATITLPDNVAEIAEAKIILATWNGIQCDEITFNGNILLRGIGHDHDLSYDEITVPVTSLRAGDNEFTTFGTTKHHGIEVLWPGPVLFVRYASDDHH